jgi:ribosomal protein S18 acetylase RimI-like enzyme
MIDIRPLTADDAEAYWSIRLRALREEPAAFLSSYEENAARPVSEIAEWLRETATRPDNWVLGAFDGALLCGIVGFYRDTHSKARHKGNIWGMYVAPEARGRGVGRQLLTGALDRARQMEGIDQVHLCVMTTQDAARALYRAVGFVTWGCEPRAMRIDGRDYDDEHMLLDLRPAG